jgi:hypothetical protein
MTASNVGNPQNDRFTMILMIIGFASISIGLAAWREGWMDEFITYAYTDPLRSASDLYHSYWVFEPSAPTYYFGLWAWRKLIAPFESLTSLRLFSVIVSLILIIPALLAYRRLVERRLAIFAIFLLSSPLLIFFAEEARSYAFSFFGGVFIGIVFLAALSPERMASRNDVLLITLTGVFGALLCSVHLVSAVIATFCLGSLVVIALWRRDWKLTIFSAALAAFVAISGAAPTLLLTSGGAEAVKSFWITRWFVVHSIIWLPAILGLPTVALIAAVVANRWLKKMSFEPLLRPAIYAFATAIAFLVLGFAFSMLKPVLTIRYLTAWTGFLIPATALVASWAIAQLGHFWQKVLLFGAIPCLIANTALALVIPHHTGAWREPGLYVHSLAACREAQIPVVILSFVPPDDDIKSWASMFAWYAGEPDRFVPATEENIGRAATQPCPIRLWAANLVPRYFSPAVKLAFAKACKNDAVEVLRFDSGYLFVSASDHQALSRWTGERSTCGQLQTEIPLGGDGKTTDTDHVIPTPSTPNRTGS